MSMALMAAMAGRRRDDRGRFMDGAEDRRMDNTNRYEGNYSRMDDSPEMRRRRDSRGRYMEDERGMRMAYEENQGRYGRMEQPQAHYWPEPHIPPYLDRQEAREERRMDGQNPYGERTEVYKHQQAERPDMIGGNISYRKADGGSGNVSYFRAKAHHHTDPMNQHDGMHRMAQQRQIGYQQNEDEPMDKQTVMQWVEEMHDGKGLRGGHFTWHQAQQHAMNKGITGQQRQLEFFWAINAMYTDFHTAAEKFGVDKPDFYACLAKLFIEDPDAVDDKVEMYNRCIVKRDE